MSKKPIKSIKKRFHLANKKTTDITSSILQANAELPPNTKLIDTYNYYSEKIPITVSVLKEPGEFVPIYKMQISAISKTTEIILEKVRQELIKRVSLGMSEIGEIKKIDAIEDKFEELIGILISKYFPDSDLDTSNFLRTYLKINSLGLGSLELLMNDENLEEVVVNSATDPVWVYHKKHGWLKTTILLKNEDQIRHYASVIGRRVGRQITVLSPLLDAHLGSGDRVNATLSPISTAGNTITIRKFSKDPWTITKFLQKRALSPEAAALIWTAIQFEMSAIIAGGTASGKTSALNVFANFFPPNQRVISIEDTREIVLPRFLHWVPLNTSLANAEGKGEINMGDLLVNSLRMRPDRIIVGEVRRKRETETLFEAIHTGHSCYATFHANNAHEVVERLTNAPIDIPKIMLPAISLIIVQFRNRRSGSRRTFQIAEITPTGDSHVIMQYDTKKDVLVHVSKSQTLYDNISLFTGMSRADIEKDLKEKIMVLDYLVKKDIKEVDAVGRIVAEYYTDKDNLMKYVRSSQEFPGISYLKYNKYIEKTPTKDPVAAEQKINAGESNGKIPEQKNNITFDAAKVQIKQEVPLHKDVAFSAPADAKKFSSLGKQILSTLNPGKEHNISHTNDVNTHNHEVIAEKSNQKKDDAKPK